MLRGNGMEKKVFISYSHDSREHGEKVLGLADKLREQGIDAGLGIIAGYERVGSTFTEYIIRAARLDKNAKERLCFMAMGFGSI